VLTEEEYKKYIDEIQNDEVPKVLFSVLGKVHNYLESIANSMNEEHVLKHGMFKLFFKQYNTVLSLSKRTSYVYKPDCDYLDIKSINILIRSMHELYLTYQYLSTNGSFGDMDKEGEVKFKYLAYKYSGEVDSKRTFDLYKEQKYKPEDYQLRYDAAIKRKNEVWKEIKATNIYKLLSKEQKNKIKNGQWKIDSSKVLSWSDLLEYTPLSKKYGVVEYHQLSQYAHMTYGSLLLEASHNYDVDGLLYHLYILASLFSISVMDSHGEVIEKENFLAKRELSLVYEFWGLASNFCEAKAR
jgi:hypothetical protein